MPVGVAYCEACASSAGLENAHINQIVGRSIEKSIGIMDGEFVVHDWKALHRNDARARRRVTSRTGTPPLVRVLGGLLLAQCHLGELTRLFDNRTMA
jgi:hypothetical protein